VSDIKMDLVIDLSRRYCKERSKKMSVLIIAGSPRENGNTEILLSILKSELQKDGIDTEFISLSGKRSIIALTVTNVLESIVVFKKMILTVYMKECCTIKDLSLVVQFMLGRHLLYF
jgi:hypothetical protein